MPARMTHRLAAEPRQARDSVAIGIAGLDRLLDRRRKLGGDFLVGVEPEDPVSGCEGQAEVLLRPEPDPVMIDDLRSLLPRDRDRVVVAAGIDHDPLVAELETVETL